MTSIPSLPAPLTLAEVEKLRAGWMYRLRRWTQKRKWTKIVLGTFGPMALFLIVSSIPTAVAQRTGAAGILMSVWCLLSMVWALVFGFIMHWVDCTDTFKADPLYPSQCSDMLTMLNRLQDGEAFRQTVLDQGREFVQVEFQMVKATIGRMEWDQAELQNAEACKALYGVPG